MASTIGPVFALKVTAPAEWNQPGLLSSDQIAVLTNTGEAKVLEAPSPSLREDLLAASEAQWVFIAEVRREDALQLYAFGEAIERALFIALWELPAIGPKLAAAAVHGLGRDKLMQLMQGASTAGWKIPGLGPKTLEKIAGGLRERREDFWPLFSGGAKLSASAAAPNFSIASGEQLAPALVVALEKLGLKPADSQRLYSQLVKEDSSVSAKGTAELVRLILQQWGRARGPAVAPTAP